MSSLKLSLDNTHDYLYDRMRLIGVGFVNFTIMDQQKDWRTQLMTMVYDGPHLMNIIFNDFAAK